MTATTTLKLPEKLKTRIARLAKETGRSAHSLMVEALEREVAREERMREFVREALVTLSTHPLIGRRVASELRELVISYGKSGYIALYRFLPAQDQIRILAIRHQRELDYPI